MTERKRKISAVFMSAILTLASSAAAGFPVHAETAKLSGNFTYIHNDTGLTIVKCKAAESIQIPSELDEQPVTAVQYDAFKQAGAKKIYIPATVTDLGEENAKTAGSLFSTSVEEITVDPGNTVYSSSEGALFRDGNSTLIFWPRGKTDKDIKVSDVVLKIAPFAFAGCKTITNVSFAGAGTVISEGAFYGCSSLSSVSLPSSLATISDQTFRNCTSLAGITIPASVTYIGSNAFTGCSKLTTIDSAAQLSEDSLASLAGSSKNLTVYLPDGSVYKTDNSGALVMTSSVPVMPAYEETTAETTAVETTPPETTADPDLTTEETTTDETSAETTLADTVTVAPPITRFDPSIGIEQTEEPDFRETTAKDTATESEPETVAVETETVPAASEPESQPYETVYYVEPKPSVFEQISADLTLVWILGGVAATCAAAAAIYLAVTKVRSGGGISARRKKDSDDNDSERHSKYYDR